MKKCPTCGKTFEDNLKFCQADGTPLVNDAPPPDPYQTIVVRPADIGAPVPLEPITPSTKAENVEDVLEIPDNNNHAEDDDDKNDYDDPLKTMVSSGLPFDADDLMKTAVVTEADRKEIFGEREENPPPPSPFGGSESSESSSVLPEPPKFSEPDLSPPSFGDLGSSSPQPQQESKIPPPSSPPPPPPFEPPKTPSVPPNTPIPSPFDASMPPGYQTPSSPPFKEPEAKFNEPSTPFGGSSFNDSAPANQQMQQQQSNFPPPAPLEQNLPSLSAPPATNGQNKTLAIVSLISGILSLLCCSNLFIPGIIAIITGFMAKGKAANNPNEYGGSGLALGGIITGGLSLLLGVVFVILFLTGFLDELIKGISRGL